MFMILLTIAAIMLFPADVFAWGPGTHVEFGLRILSQLSLLAPAIAAIISKFPEDFIYGITSPDIIVGKKYAGYHYHCHNWRMGKLILSEAETERQKAATYGYLTHLAMDVIAHNYFVPFKIIRSHETRFLSHIYWETRFDLGVPEHAWEQINRVTTHEIEEFDALLERVLRKTLFSFSTNKRIFNTILILQKMRSMRESLKIYAANSKWDLEEIDRKHYLDLTWGAVIDFLSHPEEARCLVADPAGIHRIAYARNLRRRLKALSLRKLLKQDQAEEFILFTKEQLREGIYIPGKRLPDVMDVL